MRWGPGARGARPWLASGMRDQTLGAAMKGGRRPDAAFDRGLRRSSAPRRGRPSDQVVATKASIHGPRLADRGAGAACGTRDRLTAATVARGHRPRPHPRHRLRRPLRGGQGRSRGPRFWRPDRPYAWAAHAPRRRRLGALQAGRRDRACPAGRSAGHRARAVGHPARPHRRVLQRRGRGAGRPHRVRGRRREAVDLLLPGRGARTPRRRDPGLRAIVGAAGERFAGRRCWRAGARRRRSSPSSTPCSRPPRPWRACARPTASAWSVSASCHRARAAPAGCVELWPLEIGEAAPEVDPWAPVDSEPPRSANKALARRIAAPIKRHGRARRRRWIASDGRGDAARALRRRADPGPPAQRPLPRDHPRPQARGRAGGRRRPAEALRARGLRGPPGARPLRALSRRRPHPGRPAAQPVLRGGRRGPVRSGLQQGRLALEHTDPSGERAGRVARGRVVPGLGAGRGRTGGALRFLQPGAGPAGRRGPLHAPARAYPAGGRGRGRPGRLRGPGPGRRGARRARPGDLHRRHGRHRSGDQARAG